VKAVVTVYSPSVAPIAPFNFQNLPPRSPRAFAIVTHSSDSTIAAAPLNLQRIADSFFIKIILERYRSKKTGLKVSQ
jgi:hypothetical protein